MLRRLDGDGVRDEFDNCTHTRNADQVNSDGDRPGRPLPRGRGPDDDEDGEFDAVDNCPLTHNYDQADADADGIGTACDGDERVGGSPGGGRAARTGQLE